MKRSRVTRLLCRMLSPVTTRPGIDRILEALGRDGEAWGQVVELANRFLLVSHLRLALERHDVLDALPGGLRSYLDHLLESNARRNGHLRDELLVVIGLLNRVGVEPVALKGAASLLHGAVDRTAPMMVDLDLLIEPRALQRSVDALSRAGYRPIGPVARHHHAPLAAPDSWAPVELHHELIPTGVATVARTSEVLGASIPVEIEGARLRRLRSDHRVLHRFAHDQFLTGGHSAGRLRLGGLNALVQSRGWASTAGDWRETRSRARDAGLGHELQCWLTHANRLFGFPYPPGFRATLAGIAHHERCLLSLDSPRFERISRRVAVALEPARMRIMYPCPHRSCGLLIARIRHASRAISSRLGLKTNVS